MTLLRLSQLKSAQASRKICGRQVCALNNALTQQSAAVNYDKEVDPRSRSRRTRQPRQPRPRYQRFWRSKCLRRVKCGRCEIRAHEQRSCQSGRAAARYLGSDLRRDVRKRIWHVVFGDAEASSDTLCDKVCSLQRTQSARNGIIAKPLKGKRGGPIENDALWRCLASQRFFQKWSRMEPSRRI
jgi:hypothetical protein